MNGTDISSMGFQGKPVLSQLCNGLVMCFFRAPVINRNCRAANLLWNISTHSIWSSLHVNFYHAHVVKWALVFTESQSVCFYVLHGTLMWDSYNEKFKVLVAGESGIYLVCLFNPVKSYIRHIRFILCTAASKRQQVKSEAFEVVNGNILFSERADFRWSHQNLKNCHG